MKKILDEHNIQYELIEVDLLDSGEQWVTSKEVKRYNPAVTYPTLVMVTDHAPAVLQQA
ncbi:MAG: hypothetical protein ABIB41_00620 [Nitrospirota bacterium]